MATRTMAVPESRLPKFDRAAEQFRARVWHGTAKEALSTSMELQWFGGEWQDVLCCALLAGSAFHVVEDLEESVLARSGPTRVAIPDFVLRVHGV